MKDPLFVYLWKMQTIVVEEYRSGNRYTQKYKYISTFVFGSHLIHDSLK